MWSTCHVGSDPIWINQLEIDTKDKILEVLATSLNLQISCIFLLFNLYRISSIFLPFNSNIELQTAG